MKRYLVAFALCIGATILATACGSSNNNSSTPTCTGGTVYYNGSCSLPCGSAYGGTTGYPYGSTYGSPYGNQANCAPVNGVGGYGYGSCMSCTTPNGQAGVLLNFAGVPTCGLPLTAGSGTIGGQIYSCYNSGGIGTSIGGFPGAVPPIGGVTSGYPGYPGYGGGVVPPPPGAPGYGVPSPGFPYGGYYFWRRH